MNESRYKQCGVASHFSTFSIEKSFLTDPLNINNAIYTKYNAINDVTDIIKKYIKHLSIKKMSNKDLTTNRSVGGEIPVEILRKNEFAFECLKNCMNNSTEEIGIFSESLKLGNITLIFEKDDHLDMSNY